ncbi:MAG TPA: hypothetical protein PLE04_04380 [Syntrophales bacterium]|nr:hypothetical protein [Syntrophales bacterium]
MNRGYVHLWRKSLDAGWIRNHKLWSFWTWCLLKASHREHDVIVGLQVVHLLPGQFIFGRRKAAEETGLTEREIRTIIELLKNTGNLTIKTTNKFSIITIINWHIYQGKEPDERPAKRPTKGQQTTTNNNGNNVNKKDPEFFSSQISVFRERYPSDFQKTIDDTLKAVSSTRKGGKILDSVKLKIFEKWKKHPIDKVMGGCHVFLEKKCHEQGKDEDYLLGIIRRYNGQPGKTPSRFSGPSPADDRAVSVVTCPACGRTVLSSDLAGDVCILCAEVKPHA